MHHRSTDSLFFKAIIALFVTCSCLPALAQSQPKLLWELNLKRGLGGLATLPTTKPQANIERSENGITISGEGKNCSASLYRMFKTAPFPTTVELELSMKSPTRVMFFVKDSLSDAHVCLSQLNAKQMAWTSSIDRSWQNWKGYHRTDTRDDNQTFTIGIRRLHDSKFELYTSNSSWKQIVTNTQLANITELNIKINGKNPDLIIKQVRTYYDPSANAHSMPVQSHTVRCMPAQQIQPENPLANGYQIAYMERGFSDAMYDPTLRDELIQSMRDLGVGSVRFPGGAWTYFYFGNSRNSLAAVKRFASQDNVKPQYWTYWLNQYEQYRDVDDEQFFDFAKQLDVPVIYQLNMAFWYDIPTDQVVMLRRFDGRRAQTGKHPKMPVSSQYMADALKAAQDRVRRAKQLGLDVTWELGNEDYTRFNPQSYYEQCKAFVDAIRHVDPKAKFIFCGDSHSWSDWDWQNQLQSIFQENQFTDLNDAAVHVYFSGGGGGKRDNGQKMFDGIQYAFKELKHMHTVGSRKRLDEHGMSNVGLSLTESNTIFIKGITGTPLEHSMGRALGEASVWGQLITQYRHIVHHDLVRNGYGSGTWFARMAYRPYNPVGHRYDLFLDGKIMSVMHRHARQAYLHTDENITVSQGKDNILISVINPLPLERLDRFVIENAADATQQTTWKTLTSDSLDMPCAFAYEQQIQITKQDQQLILQVTTPPFAFGHCRID